MTVHDILAEPLRDPRHRRADERYERSSSAARPRRPRPALAEALSPFLLGRPAPAHRHRPGARLGPCSSATSRPRRSTSRCRRRSSTFEGPAGRARALAISSFPTTSRSSTISRQDIAVMCRGHIVEQGAARRALRLAAPPLHQALLAAVPSPISTTRSISRRSPATASPCRRAGRRRSPFAGMGRGPTWWRRAGAFRAHCRRCKGLTELVS